MKHRKHGFTLVELLVVIGIIGLLVSILLPALSKARRSANTIKCLSNLQSIGQAMTMYVEQYHDYIPGSPATTGVFPKNTSDGHCPMNNQIWDWETPILREMGVTLFYHTTKAPDPDHATGQGRWDRINFELNYGIFVCPENNSICSLYSGSVSQAAFVSAIGYSQYIPYPSYTTGMNFMVLPNPTPNTNNHAAPILYGNDFESPPHTYSLKITQIGNPSRKIFVSEGSRYLNLGSNAFDEDYDWNASEGGAYCDWGAHCAFTNAQSRQLAPGNVHTSKQDERVLWARHGSKATGGLADSYRFNACFFDGHAETLGDLEGANPIFWAPKGSTITANEMWPDVYQAYNIQPNSTYIVPE